MIRGKSLRLVFSKKSHQAIRTKKQLTPMAPCFIPCSRTRSTSILLGSSGWWHKTNPTGGSTHPSHPSVLPPPLPPLLPALRSLVTASRRRFRRSRRWELGETPWKVAENRALKLSWERISWSQNESKSPPVQKEPASVLWAKAKVYIHSWNCASYVRVHS